MKVRLVSARWRRRNGNDYDYFVRGDVFEVSEKVGAWLLKNDAAVDVDATPDEAPTADPADDVVTAAFTAADTAISEAAQADSGLERPKNAENKEAWVKYYRKVKGQEPAASMTKEDIMAEVG